MLLVANAGRWRERSVSQRCMTALPSIEHPRRSFASASTLRPCVVLAVRFR